RTMRAASSALTPPEKPSRNEHFVTRSDFEMSTARILRKGVLGKKLGMTQIFTEDGNAVSVTVVEAGPCFVVGQRTAEKDGYTAVQLGFGAARKIGEQSIADVSRPTAGAFKATQVWPQRYVREVRLSDKDAATYETGKPV